jgi:tRNA pseudouridine13 synthase
VASSRFTLEDVVLPLIGARTMNPRNECSEVITHVLHTHGLTLDMFSRLNDRELDVSGDYRKLLCHPKDVDFEVLQYDDPLQPLIQTDLMKIHSIELTTNPKAADERPMLHAVQVGFTLPASSYATIALRELMKHPTSSDYQSEQKLGPCQLGS